MGQYLDLNEDAWNRFTNLNGGHFKKDDISVSGSNEDVEPVKVLTTEDIIKGVLDSESLKLKCVFWLCTFYIHQNKL